MHGELTDDVQQNNGSLMGLRLGWDLDHYYGLEGRFAFSNPQIMDAGGNSLGDSHDYWMDVSALYYPFGDARWRPYFGLGVGLATYRFRDQTNERIHDSSVSVPISVGVKYFYSPHFTLRFDAVDNVTLGSDNLDAMNSFFLLGSVEYRFGGRRGLFSLARAVTWSRFATCPISIRPLRGAAELLPVAWRDRVVGRRDRLFVRLDGKDVICKEFIQHVPITESRDPRD